jgi:hypothetical protein
MLWPDDEVPMRSRLISPLWTALQLAVPLLVLAGPAHAVNVVDTEPSGAFDRAVLDVGGFLQPRYVQVAEDVAAGTTGENSLILRRVRLELRGSLSDDGEDGGKGFGVSTRLSLETMPEARLVDGFVNIRALPAVQIRAGQFKTPTGRSFLVSDRRTMFAERGEIMGLNPGRQMGVMVHGRAPRNRVEYGVGAFNGEGTNRLANVNDKFMYAGRVVVAPLGGPGTAAGELLAIDEPLTFAVGYASFFGVTGPEGQEEATIGHNAEAFFHWRWVSVQGEYLWRFTDWEDPALADFNSGGYYAQVGSFLPGVPWAEEHVAVIYKFDALDELDAIGTLVPPTGPDDPAVARRSHDIGVAYHVGAPYFDGIHRLRVQVEYSIVQERENADGSRFDGASADAPTAYDNNEIIVAAHMSF